MGGGSGIGSDPGCPDGGPAGCMGIIVAGRKLPLKLRPSGTDDVSAQAISTLCRAECYFSGGVLAVWHSGTLLTKSQYHFGLRQETHLALWHPALIGRVPPPGYSA